MEGRLPLVRHQGALAVADGRDERAALVDDEGAGERAVAHVQRSVVPAQVGEDVRPVEAVQKCAELAQDEVQLLLVGRVDRHELAAGVAGRVLGVAQMQQMRARHELERDQPGHAVVPHDRRDPVRVRPGGAGVHLPSLGGSRTGPPAVVDRGQRQPVPDPGGPPALGDRAAGRLVTRRRRARAVTGRQPVGCLVEVSVGERVGLVPLVHAGPPRLVCRRPWALVTTSLPARRSARQSRLSPESRHGCHTITVRNACVKICSAPFEPGRAPVGPAASPNRP
jgi:hypothetical protein